MKDDAQDKKTRKAADKLEDRLLDAVGFVPPDNGDDEEKTVEVELADLRTLVSLAWEGQRGFASCAREIGRRQRMINSLITRIKKLED